MANDDGVPQGLKDEVDRIRQEESGEAGGGDEDGEGQIEVKLSRRQAAKQRTEEKEAAEAARADAILEATRTANERIATMAAERSQDAQRMARLEGLLEATVVNQRERVVQPQYQPEPAENVYRKKMKDANTALAAGRLDDYHDLQREANEAIVEERIRRSQAEIARYIPQPQQQFQKPDWVSAIESQYGDVIMHPHGQNTVANFHNIMYGQGRAPTPETLQKAFARTQEELGLKGGVDDKKAVERKRAMLSGGRVNGSSKGGGGGKEEYVNVPKNYKEIARRAGMSPEQYLRSYAESNPKDVSRE